MKIGITYCGGCNPRYERGTVVSRLREDFPDATIGRAGDAGNDVIVVICGCHVACASHAHLKGRLAPLIMTQETDYDALRTLLTSEQVVDR